MGKIASLFKYLFAGILLFVTGAVYYVSFIYGLDSFSSVFAGILSIAFSTLLSAVYIYVFIIKPKKNG